jgi:hypothetical protein
LLGLFTKEIFGVGFGITGKFHLIVLGDDGLNTFEDDDLVLGDIVVDLGVDALAYLIAFSCLGFDQPHVV